MVARTSAALLLLSAAGVAPTGARAGERTPPLHPIPDPIPELDFRRRPTFLYGPPRVVLYPVPIALELIVGVLAIFVRLRSAGRGTLAYVHVIERDGVRTEVHVSDQGVILSTRVGPTRDAILPLDDDPSRR